jgi:protein phosphatase
VISLPSGALVLLVGPAGSGKSTFAARCFKATEVLSSDACRAMVSDDEGDQTANAAAFAILRFIAVRRLRRGRLTVIDATNVARRHRAEYLRLAGRFQRRAIAFYFDLPLEVCLERNRRRPRLVEEDAVAEQWRDLTRPPERLLEEGFSAVHVFDLEHDSASVEIARSIS